MERLKFHELLVIFLTGCFIGLVVFPPKNEQATGMHPSTVQEAQVTIHGTLPPATKVDHYRQEVPTEPTTVEKKPETQFGWLFRSRKPYSLFEEDTYRGNLPTDINFDKFCKMHDLVHSIESFEKFETVLEIDALQSFILGYRLREINRYKEYGSSLTLEQELDEVINFIHGLVIDETEFWSAVYDYSLEINESTVELDYGHIGKSKHENRIMSLLQQKKKQVINL
jgi:hypothetical protein